MLLDKLDAPGLKIRLNKDGTLRLLWLARADHVKAGYTPKSVRLHYAIDDPGARLLIEAACRKLQAEMHEWAASRSGHIKPFDGTIASLIRRYQRDEASPYNTNCKWNTQRTYDQVLGVIEKAFGKRTLATLAIGDFRRWCDAAKKPKVSGAKERLRKAHGIIAMLRRLYAYGVMAELPECIRLVTILDQARFKQPGRRRVKLELQHVEAFVAKAIELGRLSLALGTALQFETTLRQRDVIGEWEPVTAGDEGGKLLWRNSRRRRRWVNGLIWSDISDDLIVTKETTKTGAVVSHDLKLCPIVLRVLELMPKISRVGPVIVDEQAVDKCGKPCPRQYAEHAYAREWRKIARAADVPDNVCNFDARAGGISEADDAGADIDLIRSAAGHNQASTTARYIRGTTGKSRTVSTMRVAHRAARERDAN